MTALEYELFSALREKVERPGGGAFRPLPGPWPSWTCCAPSPPWRSRTTTSCPTVDDSGVIDIREGRHPVVEKVLKDAWFVPNDTYMDGRDDTASPSSPAPTWPVNPPICGRWRSSCLMAQIGLLCPGPVAPHLACGGPGVHPHWRQRRPVRRTVHLHGGDERGGGNPEARHRQEPADPGRDRPGHLHL